MNGFTILANAIEYIENNIYEDFKRTDVAKCQEYETKNNVKVVRLNDGEGIIINNEVVYVMES